MSSLRAIVSKGFEAQGLSVEGDRAGITVSDGLDGQRMVVRVDENERVVRVERTICYPVDDFSPELSRAMDWLNQRRPGVCFAYHEAQRALVVSTAWTSPTRDPAPNQLHLLVAMAMEAAGRDGPQLERVAEGEASWEAVAEGADEAEPAAAARANRFDHAAAEPPTRSFADWPGAEDPATRPLRSTSTHDVRTTTRFMDHADGEAGELSDPLPAPPRKASGIQPTRRFEDLEQYAVRSGDDAQEEPEASREATPPELTPRSMSRTALQMAVYRMEHDKGQQVDLSAGRRSLGYRAGRGLLTLGALGGAAVVVYTYFVAPFVGGRSLTDLTTGLISKPPVDQIDPRIPVRQQLSGLELLTAELEDPLDDPELHAAYLSRALNGIADRHGALVELASAHKAVDVRWRAYQLWVQQGFTGDDARRMQLLQALVRHGRHDEKLDRVPVDVLNGLRARPPADEALIAGLDWSKGSAFTTLVDLLARPDPRNPAAAKRRSEALGRHLDRDTPDFLVLRSMVETGFAPADAAARLVQGRGLAWARGEGKAQLSQFITDSPDSITPLLKHEDEEFRLLAIDLLVASTTTAAVEPLGRHALKDPVVRVRIRAATGLAQLGHPEAAWWLALALSRRDPAPDPAFLDEVKRAIARLPVAGCVAELRAHLAPSLPVGERYYAVVALGALQNAGGLPALLEALKDPDAQVRRKAIDVCAETQAAGANLGSGVAVFREVARTDADPGVRQVAARVYKVIVGRDP